MLLFVLFLVASNLALLFLLHGDRRPVSPEPAPAPVLTPDYLPVYLCHKQVRAFRIYEIEMSPTGNVYLRGDRDAGQRITRIVPPEYVERHQPERGGYYVLYDDGYESFSPAVAFEAGYTRLSDAPQL